MGVIKLSELLPIESLTDATLYVVDANGASRKCSASDIAALAKTGVTVTDNGTSDGVHTYTFSNGSTTVAIEIPDAYKKSETYNQSELYTRLQAKNILQKRLVGVPPVCIGKTGYLLDCEIEGVSGFLIDIPPYSAVLGDTYKMLVSTTYLDSTIDWLCDAVITSRTTDPYLTTITATVIIGEDYSEEVVFTSSASIDDDISPVTLGNLLWLDFDDRPIESSRKLVNSGDIHAAIQSIKTGASGYVVPSSSMLITSGGVYQSVYYGIAGSPGNTSDLFEATPTQDSKKAIQSGSVYTIAQRIPVAPSADGTYVLKCKVSNGTPTYQWVSA